MKVPLTKKQKEIMSEFYNIPFNEIVLSKDDRMLLWDMFINKKAIDKNLRKFCPAAFAEIQKALMNNQNLQSAVFSECAYAQTLANILNLSKFTDNELEHSFLPDSIVRLLASYNLTPRYSYSNNRLSRILIQAGGCKGVDSALISVLDNDVYTIEFKEAGAKTSEPDLPKYGEDGKLIITEKFKKKNPQFSEMLEQHVGFNFFENMGHNENNFSSKSIRIAVIENYASKKFADVICTEDKNNYLTMIPSNQVDRWAVLEGEIRTAGRNHFKVWTPKALLRFLNKLGCTRNGNNICISGSKLKGTKPRGGTGISRYKITPLFFLKAADCKFKPNGNVIFDIKNVRQLKPTITAKMFFNNLSITEVKDYYKDDL